MFFDYAQIYVQAGDGGQGMVAFRREKYVPMGGPAGGDGGNGGNVILRAEEGLSTLADFRLRKHFKAPAGENGKAKNMQGAAGQDLIIKVPVGTVIRLAANGEIVADLSQPGQTFVAAQGGRGGKGNARFVTSVTRAPRIAENGQPGEARWLLLELKLLADVGLVGFPNVGKSTLLAHVSSAKPKISDYHFTTLQPHLGMVSLDYENSFVMVDIPGLIAGASEGVGLGHQFLRHIERTRLLLHVLDMSASEGRDPLEDFQIINEELEKYSPHLKARPQIIAANKMDLTGAQENLKRFQKKWADQYEIFPISAITGRGLKKMLWRLAELLIDLPPQPLIIPKEELCQVKVEKKEPYQIELVDGIWEVTGSEVEALVQKYNLQYEDSMRYFLVALRRLGVEEALREKGIKNGETVSIYGWQFEFLD
jgi:GTP-binding protein